MDPTVPTGAALLLDFIGEIEVGRKGRDGYDVIYGHNQGKLKKPLTTMTVDEVNGAITLEVALAVGGFIFVAAGFIFGVWKYVEGKVEGAKSDAMLAIKAVELRSSNTERELAAYKTHAAETFATKAGLAESLNRVHDALDRLTDRIDALISAQAKTTSRRSSGQ